MHPAGNNQGFSFVNQRSLPANPQVSPQVNFQASQHSTVRMAGPGPYNPQMMYNLNSYPFQSANPQITQPVNPQMIPNVNPRMIPNVNPQMIPNVNPRMIPNVNPQLMAPARFPSVNQPMIRMQNPSVNPQQIPNMNRLPVPPPNCPPVMPVRPPNMLPINLSQPITNFNPRMMQPMNCQSYQPVNSPNIRPPMTHIPPAPPRAMPHPMPQPVPAVNPPNYPQNVPNVNYPKMPVHTPQSFTPPRGQTNSPSVNPQTLPPQANPQTFPPPANPQTFPPPANPQTFPSSVNPQNFPPSANPQNFPPSANPQNFPPSANPQNFPPSANPQNFPPSANPQNFPPSANPQNFPPSANPQNFPPSANPQNFPPSANPQNFPPSANPQNFPPSANSQAFPPSANPQNFPPSANPQAFPPSVNPKKAPPPVTLPNVPPPVTPQNAPPPVTLQNVPPPITLPNVPPPVTLPNVPPPVNPQNVPPPINLQNFPPPVNPQAFPQSVSLQGKPNTKQNAKPNPKPNPKPNSKVNAKRKAKPRSKKKAAASKKKTPERKKKIKGLTIFWEDPEYKKSNTDSKESNGNNENNTLTDVPDKPKTKMPKKPWKGKKKKEEKEEKKEEGNIVETSNDSNITDIPLINIKGADGHPLDEKKIEYFKGVRPSKIASRKNQAKKKLSENEKTKAKVIKIFILMQRLKGSSKKLWQNVAANGEFKDNPAVREEATKFCTLAHKFMCEVDLLAKIAKKAEPPSNEKVSKEVQTDSEDLLEASKENVNKTPSKTTQQGKQQKKKTVLAMLRLLLKKLDALDALGLCFVNLNGIFIKRYCSLITNLRKCLNSLLNKSKTPLNKKRLKVPQQPTLPHWGAITLTCTGSTTYAKALHLALKNIKFKTLGIRCIKKRRSVTGGVILEVFADGDFEKKTDDLAEKLKEIYGSLDVRVTRPQKYGDLMITRLDSSTTIEKICEQLAELGNCSADVFKTGSRGKNCIWVRCPLNIAVRLDQKTIAMEETVARIHLKAKKLVRCYKCFSTGHVKHVCTSTLDYNNLCFKCGESDHGAKDCRNVPKCLKCCDNSLPASHRMGGEKCPSAVPKFIKLTDTNGIKKSENLNKKRKGGKGKKGKKGKTETGSSSCRPSAPNPVPVPSQS